MKNTSRTELNFCSTLVVNAVGLLLASWTTQDIHFSNVFSFTGLLVVIWLFNWILRPMLVIFTLPFIIMTFGLGMLLINAVIIYLSAGVVPGISIGSFWNALWASVLVSVAMWANIYMRSEKLIKKAVSKSAKDKDDDIIDV